MDGAVTFSDYQVLERNFGMTNGATWSMGNFDSDGDVDFADYQAVLEANFGTEIPRPRRPCSLLALGGLAWSAVGVGEHGRTRPSTGGGPFRSKGSRRAGPSGLTCVPLLLASPARPLPFHVGRLPLACRGPVPYDAVAVLGGAVAVP